jgi:arabinose-5-phosphate isomerase
MTNNITSYQNILSIESEVIADLKNSLDFAVMDQILQLLCDVKKQGGKVAVAGCGTVGAAAIRIAHTLSVVEIPAFYLSPAGAVHGGLGAIQKGDALILISKSGNTQEILNYIPAAKTKGVTVIGVTEDENSKLAEASDITLKVKVRREPDKWGIISSASTQAIVAAFDAIALTSMDYTGFSKEQFYVIHTGGGVGDILRKEQYGKDEEV